VDEVNAAMASGSASRMDSLMKLLDGYNNYEADLTPPVGLPPLPPTTPSAPTGQFLRTAEAAPVGTSAPALTRGGVDPVGAAAKAAWVAAGASVTQLDTVTFVIADLAGDALAVTSGTVITIDARAAGFGWYAGPSDSPFKRTGQGDDLTARNNTAAEGRVDLLTVLLHELGHVLGLGDDAAGTGNVMNATIPAGTRRELPGAFRVR
jgi:hypothetical protein